MVISNSFATHPGKRAEMSEKINEDFAHAWESNGVYYQAVADGNGRDDVLSPGAFVVNEIHRFIDTYSEPGMQMAEIKRMMNGAVHCANRVLLAFKRANGVAYAGSFASVDLTAVFDENKLISVHVGDSRAYLLREGRMYPLTKDHTEAQRLCDEGKISKEQIFIHPDRDVLTSALGFENPRIDVREGKIKKGDIILLLTDGAHKVLAPEDIQNLVFSAGNCFETCKGIIDGANMLGGPDNISVCATYIPI